jgi:prepilin-type N-terminal cleavage/methylation domain-containing protein
MRMRHKFSKLFAGNQRGMTLLEIMIVLAILALVMGLVIGPKVMDHYRDSKTQIARLAVERFADQDFPQWAVAHTSEKCPRSLVDLAGKRAGSDPWDAPYKMYCGDSAPAADTAFGAASLGPDGRENTPDDVRSWE